MKLKSFTQKNIDNTDFVIGHDKDGCPVKFTPSQLAEYICSICESSNGAYCFNFNNTNSITQKGDFYVQSNTGCKCASVKYSDVVKLFINCENDFGIKLEEWLQAGNNIPLTFYVSQSDEPNSFAFFKIISVTKDIIIGCQYVINVEFLEGNGEFANGKSFCLYYINQSEDFSSKDLNIDNVSNVNGIGTYFSFDSLNDTHLMKRVNGTEFIDVTNTYLTETSNKVIYPNFRKLDHIAWLKTNMYSADNSVLITIDSLLNINYQVNKSWLNTEIKNYIELNKTWFCSLVSSCSTIITDSGTATLSATQNVNQCVTSGVLTITPEPNPASVFYVGIIFNFQINNSGTLSINGNEYTSGTTLTFQVNNGIPLNIPYSINVIDQNTACYVVFSVLNPINGTPILESEIQVSANCIGVNPKVLIGWTELIGTQTQFSDKNTTIPLNNYNITISKQSGSCAINQTQVLISTNFGISWQQLEFDNTSGNFNQSINTPSNEWYKVVVTDCNTSVESNILKITYANTCLKSRITSFTRQLIPFSGWVINGDFLSEVQVEYSVNGGDWFASGVYPIGTQIILGDFPVNGQLQIRLVATCNTALISEIFTIVQNGNDACLSFDYYTAGYTEITYIDCNGIQQTIYPILNGANGTICARSVLSITGQVSVFIGNISCATVTITDVTGTAESECFNINVIGGGSLTLPYEIGVKHQTDRGATLELLGGIVDTVHAANNTPSNVFVTKTGSITINGTMNVCMSVDVIPDSITAEQQGRGYITIAGQTISVQQNINP